MLLSQDLTYSLRGPNRYVTITFSMASNLFSFPNESDRVMQEGVRKWAIGAASDSEHGMFIVLRGILQRSAIIEEWRNG